MNEAHRLSMAYSADRDYTAVVFDLLFLDSWLVIVNKHSGIAVSSRQGPTLTSAVRTAIADDSIQPLHRIDQPVSGVVVFGRGAPVQTFWQRAHGNGEIRRRYLAVVSGEPGEAAATLRDRIGPSTRANRWEISDSGKPAELSYRVVGKTDHHTALDIELKTGRHHQIRVQLAAHGMPIVGDAKYGARRPMRDRSIALHAYQIGLPHPGLGAPLVVTAPLAADVSIWRSVEALLDSVEK